MARLTKSDHRQRWLKKHRFELYQAGYWLFYGGLSFVKNQLSPEPYRWWEVLLIVAGVMVIIYSIVLILLRKRASVLTTIALLIGMFVAYAVLIYELMFVWQPSIGERIFPTAGIALGAYLFTMFLHWYHSMVEAGLLAAIYRIRKDERQKRKLLEENHRTELRFLMAQIQPHEQYNMLDIPYEMALNGGNKKEIAEAFLDVKSYGQYVQEKAGDLAGEVPLEDELAHCERIIAINTRRFDAVYITKEISGDLDGWQVPPLSVSALLQNAFKYGISWERQTPVGLLVESDPDRLTVTVRNRVNAHKSGAHSSGIGNKNLRQRLKLLYADKAHFESLRTSSGWYETKLTLTK